MQAPKRKRGDDAVDEDQTRAAKKTRINMEIEQVLKDLENFKAVDSEEIQASFQRQGSPNTDVVVLEKYFKKHTGGESGLQMSGVISIIRGMLEKGKSKEQKEREETIDGETRNVFRAGKNAMILLVCLASFTGTQIRLFKNTAMVLVNTHEAACLGKTEEEQKLIPIVTTGMENDVFISPRALRNFTGFIGCGDRFNYGAVWMYNFLNKNGLLTSRNPDPTEKEDAEEEGV
jgi:hypothetical protein